MNDRSDERWAIQDRAREGGLAYNFAREVLRRTGALARVPFKGGAA